MSRKVGEFDRDWRVATLVIMLSLHSYLHCTVWMYIPHKLVLHNDFLQHKPSVGSTPSRGLRGLQHSPCPWTKQWDPTIRERAGGRMISSE